MLSSEKLSPLVMIVVGEASGDLHGANLIRELKKLFPNINAFGLGGKNMREAGVKTLTDASELSVVGLIEVIKHYPRLHGIQKQMINVLKNNPPDLLILIDSPDFNLSLAKAAKQCGVKVLYYISPQVWAWRSSRVKTIKRYVDMMAVIFPFEVKYYEKADVPAQYVGHPLVKEAFSTKSKDSVCKLHKLDSNKKIIGLFPGSRKSEIEHNFPILIAAAEKLSNENNDLQFITPIAHTLPNSLISEYTNNSTLDIKTSIENIYNVINACDVIAAVSGTVTLQITLMQVPHLIIYKISPLTFYILRWIVNFKYAGIANVIANKEIAKEFIQNNAQPIAIAQELKKILSNSDYANNMRAEMKKIKDQFGYKDGSVSVAKLAEELITQ